MNVDSDASTPTEPSADKINPDANRWLHRDASGKLRETAPEGQLPAAQRTAQSAFIQALAANLGSDPEELAERIPGDTLRRLKYPVIEQEQPDGTTKFLHDIGIREGITPLLKTDHAHAGIRPGSAPQPRSGEGKYTK